MYDIITIGSSTRDVLLQSEEFKIVKSKDSPTGQFECLPSGSKIEIKKIVFATGGGGTNAAVTFARQGLKTACVGVVGDDLGGREALKELEQEKVDTIFFQKHKDGHTAYSVILVHPNAERTILSYKGEGQNFNVNEISFDKIETKWLFLDSLGGHYSILEKSVRWAKEKGIKIATNPGGKELDHGMEKLAPLFSEASIVIMNQEEAGKLSGIDYKKENEIFKFMDGFIKGIFVMTKGPEGVSVSDNQKIYKAGIPDSPVVERTGAGDAWSSGFVAEYIRQSANGELQSEIIIKAIQFATANASSVVTQFGAKAGILKKDDWGKWPLVNVEVHSIG